MERPAKRRKSSILDQLNQYASASPASQEIECPACGVQLRIQAVNQHLDEECISSTSKREISGKTNENKTDKVDFNWSEGSGDKIKGLANGSSRRNWSGTSKGLRDQQTQEGGAGRSEVEKNEERNFALPYYLENFLFIFSSVLSGEEAPLFNEEDMASIEMFKALSLSAQKLYVRLFTRNHRWLRVEKLFYTEIPDNLEGVTKELVKSHLADSESDLNDLRIVLWMLSGPEVKHFAKSLNLSLRSRSSKEECIASLIQHGTKQKSIFSFAKGNCQPKNEMKSIVLQKAKAILGRCIRIKGEAKGVFERILLIFSLPTILDEDEQSAIGKTELFSLLQVNVGQVVYPTYAISKPTPVFQSREDLIKYAEALQLERELLSAMEKGDLKKSQDLCQSSHDSFEKCLVEMKTTQMRPPHLLCYSNGWIFTRILSRSVEILQRLRNYQEAVRLLEKLLSQSVFCCSKRGFWWDRLALNLDQHLKDHNASLHAISRGLADPRTRTGHRLALTERARKLCQAPSRADLRQRLDDFPLPYEEKPMVVEIWGGVLPESVTGERTVFVTGDGGGGVVISSVETLALKYYREKEEWEKGIHAEGASFSALFCLLMWDVIFADGVDDVFRSPYQAAPLDFGTDGFYENRKQLVDSRLRVIESADGERLCSMIGSTWDAHFGQQCVGLNWDLFPDGKQDAEDLACCMGGLLLSFVCGRLAVDYRHCRGGVPDLTLWRPSTNDCKFVEVKSPNDRLSTKQVLWIDFLTRHGGKAEVCKVKNS
eukprot:m.157651 g.157651  ORF g.157651 m.157651 type:complete len:769 (+) comp38714_c0_seq10:811-3117(+)